MSDFRFACPHCSQRITADPGYRGTEITCPACQKTFTVPAPAARAPIPSHTTAAAPDSGKILPLALISFVSAFGLGLGSLAGIICGHLARKRLRRDPTLRGKGLATAGLSLSYVFLLSSLAFLTIGFVTLSPREGRQLSAAEKDANTEKVLAARRVDEVKIGDESSESAHGMKAIRSISGPFMNRSVRDARSGGSISYVLQVDSSRPMNLYCTYWGNDAGGRRFDILVNEEVIATQTLNFNDPGRFFDVEYKIPERLTHGRTNVTVVFQAYPRKNAGGIYGCQMLRR